MKPMYRKIFHLLFILTNILDVDAQSSPKWYASFHMGPKADIYRITNGSKEFVQLRNITGATAGAIIGAIFEDKVMLETGLFNNQMQNSFELSSLSGRIPSGQVVFPTLYTLLIPLRLNLYQRFENNWSVYYGFGAYVMARERLNRQPGIDAQIIDQDPVSGTTDFLQYKVSANYLTGSNILVGGQCGAEKQLYENIYLCGEIFFRSAMSYINEYSLDYSSNNDRQRSVIISSRGTSPGVLLALRYRPQPSD